jgi:hypothetical protein
VAILASLIAANRVVLEDLRVRVRQLELREGRGGGA